MKFYTTLFFISVFFIACGGNASLKGGDTEKSVSEKDITVAGDTKSGDIVSFYLELKNALAADDTRGAAAAGGKMFSALKELSADDMTVQQKSAFADIAPDAEENTDHISKNAGNIKHQREHFESLSDDMYSFVKVFGTPVTLYRDYCPMKDAYWLSEVKGIKNPYYGAGMENCGEIKETLAPKGGK